MNRGSFCSTVLLTSTRWKPYWKHRPLEEDIRFYMEVGRPSPKRKTYSPAIKAMFKDQKQIIRAYAAAHDDVTLIDFTKIPDLWQEGHMGDFDYPREELYVEDGVHFNQAGYDVYRDIYLRALDDIL